MRILALRARRVQGSLAAVAPCVRNTHELMGDLSQRMQRLRGQASAVSSLP